MISTVMEAVLRSLLLAVVVGAGMYILRVRNVLAQKAAWGLVLLVALLMPLLVPMAARWQIMPASATFTLTTDSAKSVTPAESPKALPATSMVVREPIHFVQEVPKGSPALLSDAGQQNVEPASRSTAPIALDTATATVGKVEPAYLPALRTISAALFAWIVYVGVALAFLCRLLIGLVMALRIWVEAEPVCLDNAPDLSAGFQFRVSRKISSPVTIGSCVVLPDEYTAWDTEKLRIVLAHEGSHIQQRDFYLQVLAGIYAAAFWFSPLGWWLKRTLSDLAEAISDRAGLEQAASRSSYAQILLEFAAAPRPTYLGVAMARTGSVTRRIERLLNDGAFRQAFAGGRGRVFTAVLLVPVALFAATELIRVQAAGQAPQEPAPAAQAAPATAPAPAAQEASTPQAATAQETAPAAEGAAESEAAPEVVVDVEPQVPSAPAVAVAPLAPGAVPPVPRVEGIAPMAVVAPTAPMHVVVPMPPMAMVVRVPRIDTRVYAMARTGQDTVSHRRGYSYHYSSNGDSYAVISGDEHERMTFSRDIHTEQIEKARTKAHGPFLWFMHDGKSYIVDDPAVVAKIEAMYAPMDALGKQQEELGKRQEVLGRQQEELGRQQEQATIPAPDISKEMAELNASMAKLQAQIGQKVTREVLADLQGQLGELQGRLGALQVEMGSHMGEFGDKMGKLGAMQGELGAQQGKLGAEQGRVAAEADQKVKSIINESLQNGKAKLVD